MSSVSKKFHLKDEIRKLHLTDSKGNWRAVISLKCVVCQRVHPKSPAVLMWWRCLKDKGMLRCICGSTNFIRTESKVPQGELISRIIADKTSILKQHINDEVGGPEEGEAFTRKYGVKIK